MAPQPEPVTDRTPMTLDELQRHHTSSYGRGLRSDDGYDDMAIARAAGWRVIASWGSEGWDLGEWPFVAIYVRDRVDTYELLTVTEGDHHTYAFTTLADRHAAIDYLFLWHAAGQEWAPLAHEDRPLLDRGAVAVDPKWRGPYPRP